jgi:hypothetical protein
VGLVKQIASSVIKCIGDKAASIEKSFEKKMLQLVKSHKDATKILCLLENAHPTLLSHKKYLEDLDMAINEPIWKLVAIKSYCFEAINNFGKGGFYSVISEALAANFNQYKKVMSQVIEILQESDLRKLNGEFTAFCKVSWHSMCVNEYKVLTGMQMLVASLRRDVTTVLTMLDQFVHLKSRILDNAVVMLNQIKMLMLRASNLKIDNEIVNLFIAIDQLKKCDIALELGDSLDRPYFDFMARNSKIPNPGTRPEQEVVEQFFMHYRFKYTKHTLLIRHCMECSTVGTNKKCLLLLDVG